MTVLSTNAYSRPIALAAELLAASAGFRSLAGVTTSADAAANIHIAYASDRLDDEGNLEHPLPRIIVQPGLRYESHKRGTTFGARQGDVYVALQFAPPDDVAQLDPGQQLIWFCNVAGQILDDVEARAASAKQTGEEIFTGDLETTHLNVISITLVDGPGMSEQSNENDVLFYGATFALEWI